MNISIVGFSDPFASYALRILTAAILGALIGLERDIHGRAAGLRTHLLVCLGSAVFMVLSEFIAQRSRAAGGIGDPGRIAAQVVTGIGFLGAGTIIKEGLNIRGLTTAACLWIVAAIGMTAGAGFFHLAFLVAALSLLCLVTMHYLERWYPKDSYRILRVFTTNEVKASQIIDIVSRKGVKVIFMELDRNYDTETTSVRLFVRLFHKGLTDKLAHGIITSLEKADIPIKRIVWDHQ